MRLKINSPITEFSLMKGVVKIDIDGNIRLRMELGKGEQCLVELTKAEVAKIVTVALALPELRNKLEEDGIVKLFPIQEGKDGRYTMDLDKFWEKEKGKKIIEEDHQKSFTHERPAPGDSAPTSRKAGSKRSKEKTKFEVTGVFLVKGGKHAKGCGIKKAYRK